MTIPQEWSLPVNKRFCLLRKGIEMKRFLACVVIAALGMFTIGCDGINKTTQDKIETKTTQTKDGKVMGETTNTTETTTKTTNPAPSGMTTEKTTERTTETTK